MDRIESYSGAYAFLSNMAPCHIKFMLYEFKCVESAYQAAKCARLDQQLQFQNLNGYEAKKLGRKVELRNDWHDVKNRIMSNLVWQKFQQEPFRSQLLATGDALLVEGNYWHDNYWGNCTCEGCKDIKGKNVLGNILMSTRLGLQEEENT